MLLINVYISHLESIFLGPRIFMAHQLLLLLYFLRLWTKKTRKFMANVPLGIVAAPCMCDKDQATVQDYSIYLSTRIALKMLLLTSIMIKASYPHGLKDNLLPPLIVTKSTSIWWLSQASFWLAPMLMLKIVTNFRAFALGSICIFFGTTNLV